jgi:hypothetical protein
MTCDGNSCEGDRQTSIACVLDAIPPERRSAHVTLARQLFGHPTRVPRELPNGYEFQFHSDVLEAVATFITNERRCCPFVDFELSIEAGSDLVTLRMTGPAGTRELLQAELVKSGP